MLKILVLYYSLHGSTKNLAHCIAEGVESVAGCDAVLRTVPKVSAVCEATQPSIPTDGAPYVTEADLQDCAGLALGSSTRFGNMAAAMKYFLDGTVAVWLSGSLINKPACVFSASTTMHGGQESTLLSMMLPLMHHGMVVMGLPFRLPELTNTQTGGSPYGVTHVSGSQGNTELSDDERKLAFEQGKRLATLAKKLAAENN